MVSFVALIQQLPLSRSINCSHLITSPNNEKGNLIKNHSLVQSRALATFIATYFLPFFSHSRLRIRIRSFSYPTTPGQQR